MDALYQLSYVGTARMVSLDATAGARDKLSGGYGLGRCLR
jgi:hypothetical protein